MLRTANRSQEIQSGPQCPPAPSRCAHRQLCILVSSHVAHRRATQGRVQSHGCMLCLSWYLPATWHSGGLLFSGKCQTGSLMGDHEHARTIDVTRPRPAPGGAGGALHRMPLSLVTSTKLGSAKPEWTSKSCTRTGPCRAFEVGRADCARTPVKPHTASNAVEIDSAMLAHLPRFSADFLSFLFIGMA